MEQLGSHWVDFLEILYLSIFFLKICLKNSSSIKIGQKKKVTVREVQYTFLIISRPFRLRILKVSEKFCREIRNTRFIFHNFFFRKSRLYEIIWKHVGQKTCHRWRLMRNACWIPKATNTHSEYVILIAFPLQQLLHELASTLRYTHTVCPVKLVYCDKIMTET